MYLCVGVVLGLSLASNEGVRLVGVDQVCRVVADDTSTASIDKGLDTCLGSYAKKGLGSVDIDLVQDLVGHVELGTGCVDDNGGLDLDEQLAHRALIGEVSKVVLAATDGLAGRSQVHGRQLGACLAFEQEADDLCTKTAASSSNEHMAQVLARYHLATGAGVCGSHYVCIVCVAKEGEGSPRVYRHGSGRLICPWGNFPGDLTSLG